MAINDSEFINVVAPIGIGVSVLDGETKPVQAVETQTLPVPHHFKLLSNDNLLKDGKDLFLLFLYDGGSFHWQVFVPNEVIDEAISVGDSGYVWAFAADLFMIKAKSFAKFYNMHKDQYRIFRMKVEEVIRKAEKDTAAGIKLPEKNFHGGLKSGGIVKNKTFEEQEAASKAEFEVQQAARKLPGVNDAYLEYPCTCPKKRHGFIKSATLWYIIQHLNDTHKEWTREKIADWLDELHDKGEVNIEFQPWTDAEKSATIKTPAEAKVEFLTEGEIDKVNYNNLAESAKKAAEATANLGEEVKKTKETIKGASIHVSVLDELSDKWTDLGFTEDSISFNFDVEPDEDLMKFNLQKHYETEVEFKIKDPEKFNNMLKGIKET